MHSIFQRHHIPPDEVFAKDEKHRAFMYASELIVIESQEKARREAERRKR